MSYISHEVRTPLMTVSLGMDFLSNELLVEFNDDHNHSSIKAIKDMKESCVDAIEILNDILTFNKVERGILNVELEPLSSWIFFENIIKPFQLQVSILLLVYIHSLY